MLFAPKGACLARIRHVVMNITGIFELLADNARLMLTVNYSIQFALHEEYANFQIITCCYFHASPINARHKK